MQLAITIYLIIGFAISCLGIFFHKNAWGISYKESFSHMWIIFFASIFLWPLSADLALIHDGVKKNELPTRTKR